MDSIGVVVNPIAGMGGRVGLKGTDGKLEEARRRGAEPRAPERAREALQSLYRRAPDITVYTAAGVMGEHATRDAGYDPDVVYDPAEATTETTSTDPSAAGTTAADTRAAVRAMLEQGVDLIFFVGGDGTAVDVAAVLEGTDSAAEPNGDPAASRDGETPMLGVPAGVKVYSSVFAVTPADAGRIAAEFDRVETREVNDIDEDAYREGEVRTELQAVVPVPVAPDVQSGKRVSSGSVDALAAGFAREVEPGRTYVFGPGSTVGAIESELGIEPSPLGVDVWRGATRARETGGANGAGESTVNETGRRSEGGDTDEADDTIEAGDTIDADDTIEAGDTIDAEQPGRRGDVLARDASESEILSVLADPVTIVVSPIGGQGFIFGRGNHQISPSVIRQADEIAVVAAEDKLDDIDSLRVDTDDADIDDQLRGWLQVRTGRFTTRLAKVI
ncbi:ATP-NAD kinase family protein [Natrinema halophilum]|uniref:ATP-NAD kinase family protein n=1 Tax=Natrinema halophilum TaxID=1699371 RepID=A0A7D5KIW8_9EURY|nr:ATP-NAD kinase family protein [Natrinema halophilum]QLG47458.1 ATP-NAD kinase family protein [Natrinema halophilum]